MDMVKTVRDFYDQSVLSEWQRLEQHKIEFAVNSHYLLRYLKPGDTVLDLGGGPGRYALMLAEYGCQVTLADLSRGNVDFAMKMAEERGLSLRGMQMDARDTAALGEELFDHVLLMGPLYHLTEEADRLQAIEEALRHLKPGGTLFCAFISSYAGLIYCMKEQPQMILDPELQSNFIKFAEDRDFSGMSFTHAYFIRQSDILPLMAHFPLEKLHFLSSEGMLAPNENILNAQPQEVLEAWIDLATQVCERPDLLSFAEHFLYVGKKESRGEKTP